MKKILMSLMVIAVVASVAAVGASGAWFSDTTKGTLTTTNADVEIGELIGFPLDFDNLTPSVWTDWQEVTINNASTIPMDVYIGLQAKGAGGVDLKGLLNVEIQRHVPGTGWGTAYDYNDDVYGLFAYWQKMADDMPVDKTDTYRVRLHLSEDAGNDFEGGWTNVWVLIYGAQYNGPAPDGAPHDYTPLP